MSHVNFTVERTLSNYRTRNYSNHKLFFYNGLLWGSNVRCQGCECLPLCHVWCALLSGFECGIDYCRPDESVNVSKVNDDDDTEDYHFDRFCS
jgi:hypothetical protein